MTKQLITTKAKSRSQIPGCQVVAVGLGNLAECTEWRAVNCSHALPFGYCFLCMHPRVDEMIENTKKTLREAKV
jgi:hypothetical protein